MLDAFGVTGELEHLPGGGGKSLRVGGSAVLKPVDDEEEALWRARVLDGLEPDAQRVCVPRPLRTRQGGWTAEGWAATEYVPGVPGVPGPADSAGTAGTGAPVPFGRWAELLDAGRAFHEALRGVPRPAFLDRRSHPWAVADRVAWGEEHIDALAPLEGPLRRLYALRKPIAATVRAQVIHGDLTGNVLFAERRAPAVIDFSPYWRPVPYAEAIVVADGLLYHGAGRQLADFAGALRPNSGFPQMLVRALVFRLATLNEAAAGPDEIPADEVRRFTAATALTAELARPGG